MGLSEQQDGANGSSGVLFATTHWSIVLAAGRPDSPEAADALEELCRTYWYPLYAFVRRHGYRPEDAQDLTQAFFARLLENNSLAAVRPDRGRFRWFLLASLRHYLANEWHRAHRQKRGGDTAFVPWDQLLAESRFRAESVTELSPEKAYERAWAMTLLETVRRRLEAEFLTVGRARHFEVLMDLLPGGQTDLTYAEVGRRLGLSETAVKSEVHRLKRRYWKALRTEVAHTVTSPAEVEEELRALMAVFSG